MRQMTGKITPADADEMFPTQEFEPYDLDPSRVPTMEKYKAKLFPLAYQYWTDGDNADELRKLGWEPEYGDDYVMVVLYGIGHDGHIQYDKYDFDAEDNDSVNEDAAGVGVVASKKQKNDPRYSMSLTKDVRPGEVARNMKKLHLEGNRGYEPGFASPSAPALGDKAGFKRAELQHELGHEQNNIAIAINGKTWKVVPGRGHADSKEEWSYLNNMKNWAAKKSASSGKKWSVHLTGAPVTVDEGMAEGANDMTPNWAKYVLDQLYNSNGDVTMTDLFDEGIPGLHAMFMATAQEHGLDPEEEFIEVESEVIDKLEAFIKGGHEEGVAESMFGIDDKIKGQIQNITTEISDIPGYWDHQRDTFTPYGVEALEKALGNNKKYVKYALSLTSDDYYVDESGLGLDYKRNRFKSLNMRENAEELNIGDPVIITGKGIEFEGKTGDIDSFGDMKRFVVVNLYNHGRHSFHSSDVSYNDYADREDDLDEDMYQYNKEDPYNSEFAPRAGMGRMTLRGWKQQMIKRTAELAQQMADAGQDIDKSALWDNVHAKLKSMNMDPIAQEIEQAQAELEKIRQRGGVRSRAFNK
jgi:hypothetical protein